MARRNAAAMAKLTKWINRLEKVASPQYKVANTKEMSKKTEELILDGFKKESTPYGQKWRPKKVSNGQQILVEKDRMRKSFKALVGLDKFTISNPTVYYNTHQYGDSSRNIPKRQMVPDPNKLPIKWIREYNKIVQERFFRVIKGGRIK